MALSDYCSKKQVKPEISKEVATDMVVDLLDYYDIDVENVGGESKEEKQQAIALERALNTVRGYFMSGKLEVDRDEAGKIRITHHLKGGDTLVYGEIGSKHKLAMERFDPEAGYTRIYAFMGSLSGAGKGAIEKLSAQDLAVVEVLGTVFSNA